MLLYVRLYFFFASDAEKKQKTGDNSSNIQVLVEMSTSTVFFYVLTNTIIAH